MDATLRKSAVARVAVLMLRLVTIGTDFVEKTDNCQHRLKISAQLKSIRDKLDLTQAQMADLLGINRSYLAELETDESQCRIGSL